MLRWIKLFLIVLFWVRKVFFSPRAECLDQAEERAVRTSCGASCWVLGLKEHRGGRREQWKDRTVFLYNIILFSSSLATGSTYRTCHLGFYISSSVPVDAFYLYQELVFKAYHLWHEWLIPRVYNACQTTHTNRPSFEDGSASSGLVLTVGRKRVCVNVSTPDGEKSSARTLPRAGLLPGVFREAEPQTGPVLRGTW